MFCEKGDGPDLGVEYSDCGPHEREMAELYSYSEYKDFDMLFNEFSKFLREKRIVAWSCLSDDEKMSLIDDLLSQLSLSEKDKRQKALCCLLYLAQGDWAYLDDEILDEEEETINKEPLPCTHNGHFVSTQNNVMLLYSRGLLPCLIQILNMETSQVPVKFDSYQSISMKDTLDLRLCLNLLYTLLEVMRIMKKSNKDPETQRLCAEFQHEISSPMMETGDELLLVKLFRLLVDAVEGSDHGPHWLFPLKKILLCVYKVLLISFGDFETLEEMRIEYREAAGLSKHFEHTLQILRHKLPALKVPLPENQNTWPLDQKDMGEWRENGGEVKPRRSLLRPSLLKAQTITSNSYEETDIPPEFSPVPPAKLITALAWRPKIDERELQAYIRSLRMKYFGLELPYADIDTLFGFPESVQEGIKVLKQNLYTPLSDVQLREEEQLSRHFMLSRSVPSPCDKPHPSLTSNAEVFYDAAWRDIRQYIITILKLMLAATPMSVERDKYLNIDAEVDSKRSYLSLADFDSMDLASDIKRHKDIVVKTISSIILVLLKHYKLNHVLQFEFLCSCLMNGNCMPFIIKYFNQNMDALVLNTQTQSDAVMEYPRIVRLNGHRCFRSDVSLNAVSAGRSESSNPSYSSTIITTSINLLRILNKLVKNKQSRIMALIYFKSFAPLKSALRLRHNVLQFYALKLIKLQSRYQGRQWRKVNIKILGYVFVMVRHRFHDDWAYGNELETKQQLDSQADEAALKRIVMRFNRRRYTREPEPDFVPGEHSVSGALDEDGESELSEEFQRFWVQWTEQKVLESDFDWDQLTQQELVM